MRKIKSFIVTTSSINRSSESGVALLTVLALLSIFAVVLVGFTYTIRMEEFTVEQYADSVTVEDFTEAATQGALSQLARELDPRNEHYVLGRPQPPYVSLLDPWALGYAGRIGNNITYDARSHQPDLRSDRLVNRQSLNLKIFPTPIPLGVDEDMEGDVTGLRYRGGGRGDGAPGLANIDDDLDGVVDNPGTDPDDDDEDFRVDEDGLDIRRPDSRGSSVFPPGTGYDADGDQRGVFDESAKININLAGNNNSQQRRGEFTYNQGVSPSELDLPLFLFNRIVRYLGANGNPTTFSNSDAEQLAQMIVNFRYGATANGGTSYSTPGRDNQDDNGNNNPQIVDVQEYDNAMRTSTFDRDPFVITGDGIDNDNDGLMNEEDETYIGPTTDSSGGSFINSPIGSNEIANAKDFRPGDKIDNDGDGDIDEDDEGVDEPAEFSIVNPVGDDRPFGTVDDLRLLNVAPLKNEPRPNPQLTELIPSMFNILRDSVTIYSESDEMSGPLSGRNNEVGKINPNGSSNWRASDIWDRSDPDANRADFQYSPPVLLEDLLTLQFDSDGDWQLHDESNLEDGEDNDGDGLIDEPSDDWDKNFFPSGNFDGSAEADVGSTFMQDGRDNDMDGDTVDEARRSNERIGRLRNLTYLAQDANRDPRDVNDNEIRRGMVVEGDGQDSDGDNLIDDSGDFNGDGLKDFDPEFHVSEDAWGDLSGDGYPGLGADPELADSDPDSPEGLIVKRPDRADPLLITSWADDDWDGFADFYDPQVLAAMYAPELDGVDNDSDGEVDEIGERYIAAFDDDEDGRYDEDPPDFQIALNLIDFIDTWAPYKPALDADTRQVLGKSDNDAVLSDPITQRSFELFSTRQRAFRMHPRILAGVSSSAKDQRLFTEQMRFLLPNPPQTGMLTEFSGVEAIRINEVMPKPVIRLEAEEVLTSVGPNTNPGQNPKRKYEINVTSSNFRVLSGDGDDGHFQPNGAGFEHDTSWGMPRNTVNLPDTLPSEEGFIYMPQGFRHTLNRLMPIINMDALAPEFIFSVTNHVVPTDQTFQVGRETEEAASWTFENIPAGVYDVVFYLHPMHQYRPEVQYSFNGREITFKSDYAFGDINGFTGLAPEQLEFIRRDTAWNFYRATEYNLHYRLTPYPFPNRARPLDSRQRVVVGNDGRLSVEINATEPLTGVQYATSFDRIELINLGAQYVELVNISTDDIDLSGWTVTTPYGKYILPKDTIIRRMKPSWEDDDGREIVSNNGRKGNDVPFENLIDPNRSNNQLSSDDLRLEDNKLLLAFDAGALTKFLQDNYPDVENVNEIIVEPNLTVAEKLDVQNSLRNDGSPTRRPNAQVSDLRFRVVDVQQDILTNNPVAKHITLYDPAGNFVDSFEYRTTFNNAIVDIANNGQENNPDIIALPGYKGFEAYERTDPTYFRTDVHASSNGIVSASRYVPSSMVLDAKQAMITRMTMDQNTSAMLRAEYGGYQGGPDPNQRDPDRYNDMSIGYRGLIMEEPMWNGWDFIGDFYQYPRDMDNNQQGLFNLLQRTNAVAREAVAPGGSDNVKFYQKMGGFENAMDMSNSTVRSNFPTGNYVAFTWRMGARELIRAGYDPDVDDQLTVRVMGRQYVDDNGSIFPYDMPVGEVLIEPSVRVVNPGENDLDEQQDFEVNPDDIFFGQNPLGRLAKMPVFAKLRNGDTAFTIDLRDTQGYDDLWRDLNNNSNSEPMIEISVIIRKSTPDYSPFFVSNDPAGANNRGVIYPASDRPDLGIPNPIAPNSSGYYPALSGLGPVSMSDDNYFFRGIELFGRGRKGSQSADDDRRLRLLAGTPGRDNSGYVPAYPRRRYDVEGNQRDISDIIDNTAYVKNAPLATVGEISRLFTGNKFETINSPIIPQRLEDIAVNEGNRIESNPELARRSQSNNRDRLQLAQRERLDQWENRYNSIYSMITTSLSGIVSGRININTAPREVLMALPFCPPVAPGELAPLMDRHNFNAICADFILEGRQAGGHDMLFGIHSLDDDRFLRNQRTPDTLSDYKFPSVGRDTEGYKEFDDIESEAFNPFDVQPENIRGDSINLNDIYLSSIVSLPDDGPYTDVGTLLSQITHLRRRDRLSEPLRRDLDRTMDNIKDGAGDLRERLNEILNRELTNEDMEAIMNRISNLVTVRSRSFSILTRGRIFDNEGNITAQRKIETVYKR